MEDGGQETAPHQPTMLYLAFKVLISALQRKLPYL